MSRWVAAAVLLLALTPMAAAQVPEPPDPAETVEQACALSPVDLPVCPREEPAGPAPQKTPEEQHDHAPPAAPEDAQQLADEAREDAEGIVEDPTSAPDRVASLVATVVQFVKDLLDLPLDGLKALEAKRVEVASSFAALAASAKAGVADAVEGAVQGVKAALADLLARNDAPAHAERDLPVRAPLADDAKGLLDGVLQGVPSPIAR